jgi:hypothetical protein
MDVGSDQRLAMDDVLPSAESCAASTPKCRWSRSIRTTPARSPSAGATRRQRRDRRDLLGDAGLLPRLHAARLSTEGKIYTCLFATEGHDLRALLRAGAATKTHVGHRAIWQARSDRYSEIRTAETAASCARSKCPTSVAERGVHKPLLTQAARPATYRGRRVQRARRDAAHRHRRRASADALPRQARAGHADDPGPGAPEALAIGYLRNQRLVNVGRGSWPRCRSTGTPSPAPSSRTNGVAGPGGAHGAAHRHHRLRPGHGVRRPDGGDRRHPPARGRARSRTSSCTTWSSACGKHETIYKQAGAVHGCALARQRPKARRS